MSDLAPLQGLLTVVEVAAVSVLAPPAAWLLAKAWRRSAAGRRLVWITVFAMLLALPLLALVAPSLAVIALPAPPPLPVDAPVAASVTEPSRSGFSWPDLIPLAAMIWLAGLAKQSLSHLVTLVRLERMRRGATVWSLPVPVPVGGCDLMVSEDCPGPMTWGVLRPVIMLPDEAFDWPAERLTTVLRHEMAHVRRRDGLAQTLALIACALYWPNPLVWAAARALRRECELAADDAVIASGMRPSDYAGQLVALAAEWRERRLTPTGLAMAAPPALSQRVQSILSTDAIRTGVTAMDTFKLVLLGGAATAALTLARPSVAEVPAPAAPAQRVELSPAAAQAAQQPSVATRPAAPAGAAARPRARDRAAQTVEGSADEGDAAPEVVLFSLHQNLEVAQQDVPAPPAPPAAATTPLPPAGPAPALPPAGSGWSMTWIPNPNGPPSPRVIMGGRLTREQRAELDRKMAEIGPAIDKAIKDSHIEEKVQQALSAQDAKTREEAAKQLKEIGPRIQRSIAGAQFQMRFAQLQPQFEATMREQRRQAQERQAQAEDRVAAQLEEQAKRARERAQRTREQLKDNPPAPQPAPTPKN